jgi:hypothetical protein
MMKLSKKGQSMGMKVIIVAVIGFIIMYMVFFSGGDTVEQGVNRIVSTADSKIEEAQRSSSGSSVIKEGASQSSEYVFNEFKEMIVDFRDEYTSPCTFLLPNFAMLGMRPDENGVPIPKDDVILLGEEQNEATGLSEYKMRILTGDGARVGYYIVPDSIVPRFSESRVNYDLDEISSLSARTNIDDLSIMGYGLDSTSSGGESSIVANDVYYSLFYLRSDTTAPDQTIFSQGYSYIPVRVEKSGEEFRFVFYTKDDVESGFSIHNLASITDENHPFMTYCTSEQEDDILGKTIEAMGSFRSCENMKNQRICRYLGEARTKYCEQNLCNDLMDDTCDWVNGVCQTIPPDAVIYRDYMRNLLNLEIDIGDKLKDNLNEMNDGDMCYFVHNNFPKIEAVSRKVIINNVGSGSQINVIDNDGSLFQEPESAVGKFAVAFPGDELYITERDSFELYRTVGGSDATHIDDINNNDEDGERNYVFGEHRTDSATIHGNGLNLNLDERMLYLLRKDSNGYTVMPTPRFQKSWGYQNIKHIHQYPFCLDEQACDIVEIDARETQRCEDMGVNLESCEQYSGCTNSKCRVQGSECVAR